MPIWDSRYPNPDYVELKFKNRTAPSKHVLLVHPEACDPIMSWYGAFHAGDDYTVKIDGKKVKVDQNGERI
jgi:hypothetical protein